MLEDRMPMDNSETWKSDRAGVLHYQGVDGVRESANLYDVERNARAAMRRRPNGPCWFWTASTGVPMAVDDTVETLVQRWSEWRLAESKGELGQVLWSWSTGFR